MPLFSQYQQLLCKKGQRRWHTSLANAVLHMKELFMNDSFWSTFGSAGVHPEESLPWLSWFSLAKQMGMRWGQATTEGFVEKPTSREGDMAGREGNERSGNPSREKQITYFIALHIFKTQCKHWIMVSPHGWRDLAPPPPHFSTSQTELEWLHAHFQ